MVPLTVRAASALDLYLREGRPELVKLPGELALFLSKYGCRMSRSLLSLLLSNHAKTAGIDGAVFPHITTKDTPNRTPNRVELENVPHATAIQIHVGNETKDVKGCFAVGTSRSKDWVGHSGTAMNEILELIANDGGPITVKIIGSPSGPTK